MTAPAIAAPQQQRPTGPAPSSVAGNAVAAQRSASGGVSGRGASHAAQQGAAAWSGVAVNVRTTITQSGNSFSVSVQVDVAVAHGVQTHGNLQQAAIGRGTDSGASPGDDVLEGVIINPGVVPDASATGRRDDLPILDGEVISDVAEVAGEQIAADGLTGIPGGGKVAQQAIEAASQGVDDDLEQDPELRRDDDFDDGPGQDPEGIDDEDLDPGKNTKPNLAQVAAAKVGAAYQTGKQLGEQVIGDTMEGGLLDSISLQGEPVQNVQAAQMGQGYNDAFGPSNMQNRQRR